MVEHSCGRCANTAIENSVRYRRTVFFSSFSFFAVNVLHSATAVKTEGENIELYDTNSIEV